MNKELFEQGLLHRLLVDHGYGLLIDANEHTAQLPEHDEWESKLEHSEPEFLEQQLLEYIEACQNYHDSLPIIGSSLDNVVYKQEGKVIWKPERAVLPALLLLKDYASRILLKSTISQVNGFIAVNSVS